MRVGFIGTGRMGSPMVRRLVAAGHDVVAHGRSAKNRWALTELGARAVTSMTEVGESADAVIVCVFTDEQVMEVCLNSGLPAAMPRKSVLVIHTTGSPSTTDAAAADAAHYGVDVVDAPVSGGPHDVAAGHVTLFVGGADDAVAQVKPILRSYGDPVLHVGPLGAGQRVKLINNTLFASQIGLLAEAVQLGNRLGVPESTLHRSTSAREWVESCPGQRRGDGFCRGVHRAGRRVHRQGRGRRQEGRRGSRHRPRSLGQHRERWAGRVKENAVTNLKLVFNPLSEEHDSRALTFPCVRVTERPIASANWASV
jgi:3-hydroxyisobutyrate dehydrogenase-like beta-hydroxyacid dehydrogenase